MIDDFRGEFYHSIDNKGRLSIPKKFASRLIEEEKGKIVVTRGIDRCLWIYPATQFEELAQQVKQLPMFDPRSQKFHNTFFSGSHDDIVDKAGRILIPKHLLEYAQINKEIAIVGSLGRIQVWSLENWNRHIEQLTMSANETASEMASLITQINSAGKGAE